MYLILEGFHGSGKTTIATKLVKKLNQLGKKSKYKHFPDENTTLGKFIREEILTNEKLVPNWEITGLLYASEGNIFHLSQNKSAEIRILDRHPFSSGLIYQNQIPSKIRKQIYGPQIKDLQKNGVVFMINVDPKIALQRAIQRNKQLKEIEKQTFQAKTQDKFLENFEKYSKIYLKNLKNGCKKFKIPFFVVNNSSTPEKCVEKIIEILKTIK